MTVYVVLVTFEGKPTVVGGTFRLKSHAEMFARDIATRMLDAKTRIMSDKLR